MYHTQDEGADEIVNQTAFYFTESAENMRRLLNYGQYLCEVYRPYDGEEPYAFVSYKHNASYYVSIRNFFKKLRDNGIRFWYDDDIRYQENWREKLRKKNTNSRIYIALLSNEYFASVECWRELLQAIAEKSKRGNRIHLVLLKADVRIPQKLEDLLQYDIPKLEKEETDGRENSVRERIERISEMMSDYGIGWSDVADTFNFGGDGQYFRWCDYMEKDASLAQKNLEDSMIDREMEKIRNALE